MVDGVSRLAIPHATKSMATIESLQPVGSVHALIRIFDELSVFNPRRPPSAFDQNETSTEFPNAGLTEFPNALETPPRVRLFT
jgi:hypothetical protein